MTLRELLRRLVSRPAWGVGCAALVLRAALVFHAWTTNPLVREPSLDGRFYLRWAADIAGGDLSGSRGVIAGEPWFFNPLYAYLLAPFVALLTSPVLPILLAQAVLGAGTAAMAAAAASRTFDRRAGWTTGLLVAFAAPLAQLDAHIAVAELSAFLVAGACFACAPVATDAPSSVEGSVARRASAAGPLAAGLWLGVGALARPIVPLALPFVAWRFAKTSKRRFHTATLVVLAFAACAVPSLLRNWVVSGEPAVWTAAGGINAHLGNNPVARADRTMASSDFRFAPETMHDDARRHVEQSMGRRVSRTEVGSWYWRTTLDEVLFRDPAASLTFYAQKARWFFGPIEVPSSASHSLDVGFSPWLRLAFVPTWLTASLALAGAWAWRRRADVLLGPGAIAFAHLAMLTLVFPLSHYRAPAIPALAVLAGGAVTAAWGAWRGGRRGAAGVIVGVAAATAVAAALPPGPDPLRARDETTLAILERDRGDYDAAERHARAAIDERRAMWPGRLDTGVAWATLGEVQLAARRWADAKASLDRAVELDPAAPTCRVLRSSAHEGVGDFAAAEIDARQAIALAPADADGWERLGTLLTRIPSRAVEARAALQEARRRGAQIP
ncbi:MAG: hypothetical protein K8T90_05985 [Planctomycetes bacterium]|nr:hypothetical protein [Planctomycetota bacterium]